MLADFYTTWTGFHIDGCATVWTVALRRGILKWKKECATISLGIIFHSIAFSQPSSHDTVPLSVFLNKKILKGKANKVLKWLPASKFFS
jgi:hypothetical protein